MKTTILTFAFLFFVAGSMNAKPVPTNTFTHVTSQSLPVFENFTAHRQGDAAILNWIASAEDVTSFVIQRSYDGEFFDDLTEVTPETSHWNRYTDETVEPGIIYYRIIAYSNGVGIECSATEEVKIVKHK